MNVTPSHPHTQERVIPEPIVGTHASSMQVYYNHFHFFNIQQTNKSYPPFFFKIDGVTYAFFSFCFFLQQFYVTK